MTTKDDIAHVKRGFRLVAAAGAVFITFGVLIFGLDSLRFPNNARSGSFAAYHPLVVGSCFVAIASLVIMLTMSRWIKALPGLLAYAAFGGMIAIANGGFHSYIASMSVSRTEAALFTALLATDCGLSITFSRRQLGVIDRIALLNLRLLSSIFVDFRS